MASDLARRSATDNLDTTGSQSAATPTVGKQTLAAAAYPGGHDALGTKENQIAPYYNAITKVVAALHPAFQALGMTFRPEMILATVLQEAEDKNPVTGMSGDYGLGLMQVTPAHDSKRNPPNVYTLDPPLDKLIGWDNTKVLSENIAKSKWRDGTTNLLTGGNEMLLKAKRVKALVPTIWAQMSDEQRWRATMFAYNAGEGNAKKALKAGGPNAAMVSHYSFTDKRTGKHYEGSHDYTKELDQKLDYVDAHDPFASSQAAAGTGAPVAAQTAETTAAGAAEPAAATASGPASAPAAPAVSKRESRTQSPALAEVSAGHAVIQLGMRGSSVRFIQSHVGTPVDGDYETATQAKVRAFQVSHGLAADGVVGTQTYAAMTHAAASPVAAAAPTTTHAPPPAQTAKASGSAVDIATRFVGQPSWSHTLGSDIRGAGWTYDNDGRQTDNCAEFVSSCLRMAGEIGFQEPSVLSLEARLRSAGWKYRAGAKESKAGDVWIHEASPRHTVLVASDGGGETVGADGGSKEFIKREPMPYPNAKYMYRG